MKSKYALFIFVLFSTSIAAQIDNLDVKNGFKEYKLGSSIDNYTNATIGDFACPPTYIGFFTRFQHKLYPSDGFSYKKMIVDYTFKPETTIFGFPVSEIQLSTYNKTIVRIIVRIIYSNNPVPIAQQEFGGETESNYDDIHKIMTYYWRASDVEMSIRTTNTTSALIKPNFCITNFYDIHFYSLKYLKYLESEVSKNNSNAGKDY